MFAAIQAVERERAGLAATTKVVRNNRDLLLFVAVVVFLNSIADRPRCASIVG
jgi:hypothetical protein